MKKLINTTFTREELLAAFNEKLSTFDFSKQTSLTVDMSAYALEKVKDTPDPRICITPSAYIKMRALVQNSLKELAWHGIVEELSEGNLLITDIMVYPQVAASATVDANEALYGTWLMSHGENLNKIRMQGHSHVNMGVSPSGTDTQYYESLLSQINNYYIFIIMNKSDLMMVRYYDKRTNLMYSDLPLYFWENGAPLNMNDWLKTQMTHVEDFKYIVPPRPAITALATAGQPEMHPNILEFKYRQIWDKDLRCYRNPTAAEIKEHEALLDAQDAQLDEADAMEAQRTGEDIADRYDAYMNQRYPAQKKKPGRPAKDRFKV